MSYKTLKKLLKNLPNYQRPPAVDQTDGQDLPSRPLVELHEWFVRILNEELEKFNDFYVDKEEEFVIRFQMLKERIDKVMEKSCKDGVITSESEFSEEIMDIRKDFVTIHGEMVLLKNYSSLNFAGLIKILKKYDKRTGELLRLPFTQVALDQPFFTTEPLTRLVRECEANLELLFPLTEEVIESTSTPQDSRNPPSNSGTNISSEISIPQGDEAVHIYRSTVAAIRTLRGLRKASSTYNPLSFSSFVSQDDGSVGALTEENSSENSSAALNNEEADHEEVHSANKLSSSPSNSEK